MSLRQRRFAGSRMAAQPLADIPEQLKDSLMKLADANAAQGSAGATERPQMPASLSQDRPVPGTEASVHLMADPRPIDIGHLRPEDLKDLPANLESLESVVQANPKHEYTLAWSVDGNDGNLSPRERVRVAREAERGWQELIPKLEEGAIVTNTPVGAPSGDYERADLYMRYGFGPVGADMTQYGIVKNGRIEPISPMVEDLSYVQHLADRAAKGGDAELSQQLMDKAKALRELDANVEVRNRKQQIAPNYYDDGDYYDDGYYDDGPPIDAFGRDAIYLDDGTELMGGTREEIVAGVRDRLSRLNDDSVPYPDRGVRRELAIRRRAKELANQPINAVEAPTPRDIAELRQAQVQLAQDYPQSTVDNVLDEIAPPMPPRPITQSDLGEIPRRAQRVNPNSEDPSVRTGNDLIRREQLNRDAREQARRTSRPNSQSAIHIREQAKNRMLSARQNPEGVGRVIQEHYSPEDVADLRRLQEAMAQATPSELASDGLPVDRFNRIPQRPVAPGIWRNSLNDTISVGDRDRILNRRQLTPEQGEANFDVRLAQGASARISNALDSFAVGHPEARLIDHNLGQGVVRPNPQMPGRRALEIVEREVQMPDRENFTDLQQAVANLRQIRDRGYQSLERSIRENEALLQSANRAPAAQVRELTDRRLQRPNNPPPLPEGYDIPF